MSRSLRIALLAASFAATAAALTPQPERDSVASLAWLAGCWTSEGGEAGSGEQWMAPAGGTLLGVSRTVQQGKTVAHEFMSIRETAEGSLVFVAHPSGEDEASFPAARQGQHEIVFENPRHDFPQRVIYRLDAEGVLRARIEGVTRGEAKAVDYPMRRVSCDPAPTPTPVRPARRRRSQSTSGRPLVSMTQGQRRQAASGTSPTRKSACSVASGLRAAMAPTTIGPAAARMRPTL